MVRQQGSVNENATYLEIGGDPDNRVYFERDGAQDIVLSVPGFLAPLNLYSEGASRIAFVIEFNQALFPSEMNISTSTMGLEFLDGLVWTPLDTRVTLVGNCVGAGARVRLEPIGVLPQGSQVRAVVRAGIQDLVGEATQNENDMFAVAPTQAADFSSLTPSDRQSDEFPEGFDFGGDSSFSFEDTEALFETPAASWEAGA